MKPVVKKCECGRVSNPITLNLVKDAWLNSKNIAHWEFDCPQCKKTHVATSIWDESGVARNSNLLVGNGIQLTK